MNTKQQLIVAETVPPKGQQRRGLVYKFVHQFIDSDPDALDPYEDYPNGFIFLVMLALLIAFINVFVAS